MLKAARVRYVLRLAATVGAVGGIVATLHAASHKMTVTVVDRQDHGGTYTYVVPGFSTSTGTATGGCSMTAQT